jgi:predicted secreted protein
MSILTAFFIYLLIWWTMLFTVLPLGVRAHDDAGKGFDSGAPVKADMKKKLWLNTFISAAILAVIWVLVELDIIRWTEWFGKGLS